MKDKLTSRKLWMAVAAFSAALANGEPVMAAVSAMVYILVEGFVDSR
jgi:hypothetical protein